jgi:hypothetical protein
LKLKKLPESALEEVYEEEIKYLKPMLDVSTRWNSTYDMIGRAFELQEAIKLYALSKDIDMNTACWDRFKEIHNFLKKFKEVSVYMCADTYPTLSMAVPNYNKLLTHIIKHGGLSAPLPTATTVDSLHNACVAAYAKITKYYMSTSDCYTIATVLDPRLKLDFYDPEERQSIFDAVQSVFDRDYNNHEIPISEDEDDEDIFIKRNPTKPMELRTYCDSSIHSMPGKFSNYTANDVLHWWKTHQGIYPKLALMARDYLAIPATSASSERLFSSSKNLITNNRNSLNEDTIQAHECLKSWIK